MQNDNTIPQVIQRTHSVPSSAGEIWLAGGCFWGTEEYMAGIHGVLATDVGYANGYSQNPTYEEVCAHRTGYAETCRVVYDPGVCSLPFLLELYFRSVNPTSINRQGGDMGEQYRTGIYYGNDDDLPVIREAVAKLAEGLTLPVAIEVKPLNNYYLAEEYHQKYLKKNPGGYCHIPRHKFREAQDARDEGERHG